MVRSAAQALDDAENATKNLSALVTPVSEAAVKSRVSVNPAVVADVTASHAVTDLTAFSRTVSRSLPQTPSLVALRIDSLLTAEQRTEFRSEIQLILQIATDFSRSPANSLLGSFLDFALTALPQIASNPDPQLRSAFVSSLQTRTTAPFDTYVSTTRQSSQNQIDQVRELFDSALGSCERAYESTQSRELRAAVLVFRSNVESLNDRLSQGEVPSQEVLRDINSRRTILDHVSEDLSQNQALFLSRAITSTDQNRFSLNVFLFENHQFLSHSLLESLLQNQGDPTSSFSQIASDLRSSLSRLNIDQTQINSLSQNPTLENVTRLCAMRRIQEETPRSQEIFAPLFGAIATISPDKISSLIELSHLYSVSSAPLKSQIQSFLSRPVIASSLDSFVTLLQNHHSIGHLIERERNSSLRDAYRQVLSLNDRLILAFSQGQAIDSSALNNSLVASAIICQSGSSLTSSLLGSNLRPNSIQAYLSHVVSIPQTLASLRGNLRNEAAANYARVLISIVRSNQNSIALESALVPLLQIQALSTSLDLATTRAQLSVPQTTPSDTDYRFALMRFEGLSAARRITTPSTQRTYLSYLGASLSALRSGDSSGSDAIAAILSLYSTAYSQRNFDLLRRIELGEVPGFNLPSLGAILAAQSSTPPSSFSSLLAQLNPNQSPTANSQFIAFRDGDQLRRGRLSPDAFARAGFELCLATLQLSLRERESEIRTTSITRSSSAYSRERSRLSNLGSSGPYTTLNADLLAPGSLTESLENSSAGLRAAQIHLALSRRLFDAANTLTGQEYSDAVTHCRSVYGTADAETVRGYLIESANSHLQRAQMISDAAANQSDAIFTIHRSVTTLRYGSNRHVGRLSLLRAAQNFGQLWTTVDSSSFDANSDSQRRLLAVVTQTASSSFNFGQTQYSRSRQLQSAVTRILSLTQNIQTQLDSAREHTASSDGSSAIFWRYGGFSEGQHRIQATELPLFDYSLDENLQHARTLAQRGDVSGATALLTRTSTTIDLRLSRFDVMATHQRFFGSPQSFSQSILGYSIPSMSEEQFDTVSYLGDLDRAESLVRSGRIPQARILLDSVARSSAIGSRRQELLSLRRIADQSAAQFEAQSRGLSSLLLSPTQNAQNADEARAYAQNAQRAREDANVPQMVDILTTQARQAHAQAAALDFAMRSTTSLRDLSDPDLAYSLVEALADAGHRGRLNPSVYAQSMRDLAALARTSSPNRIMGYLFEHPALMQEGLSLLEPQLSPSALNSLRAELNFHQSLPGYSSLSRRAMVVSDMAQREFATLCDVDSLFVSGRIDSQTASVMRDNSYRFGSLGALAVTDPTSFSRSLANGTFATSLFEATLNHVDALQSIVVGRSTDLSPHDQALSVARTNADLRMASYGFIRESNGMGYSPLVLDSDRARSLFALVAQSDSTINQFANVSLSLSGAFSPINMRGAAQVVSTSQRSDAYRTIALANGATQDSFRLVLNPSARNISPQLATFAQTHQTNLESSTRAVETGARRERNFHRATTLAEMVGAGILSPVFGLPVAVYFGVNAIGGFAEQIRGARGYHNLSTLERALGIGGIALAGLGFVAHGTGTFATELNAQLASARELNPILRESLLLRGVGLTNASLGATTILGGFALGAGSVYEMYLRDPSANAFDYGLAIWQATMPGFRAALAPGVGRYNPFRGIISPSLLHGESLGARAYRTGMFLAFGASRGQLIEEYNASVSAEQHRAIAALTPEQRERLQTAVAYAQRNGGSIPSDIIAAAAEFYRRNPLYNESELANVMANLNHEATTSTSNLTQRGQSTLDRLEFTLRRPLTAQERLYAVDQILRSPNQDVEIPTLIQNLSNRENLPPLTYETGTRSDSPTTRPSLSRTNISDLSETSSLREIASEIVRQDPWSQDLTLSRLPQEIREPLEFLIRNPSFIADPAGTTPQSRMALEGTRRRIEEATSSLSPSNQRLNVMPNDTDSILHIATRANEPANPNQPTPENMFTHDRAVYLLGSMLADDTSFVTAQRNGDTRTMRQIAERYSSRMDHAEDLVNLSQSRTPQLHTEIAAAMEASISGSRVSVDPNGVAHEEMSIGQGEHTASVTRSQFNAAVDLAYDAMRYVGSMGDENSIPESRRTPERIAQIHALTSDPSINRDLFAMRSNEPNESQGATDRILVRSLESLGHLSPVNLGVEDSALSTIATDSSLEYRGTQRRANSEPRAIFVDPITDELFAIPVISPSSLNPGQTLVDAYRESVNLHTGATRTRDLASGSLVPASTEDHLAVHFYRTQEAELGRPLTDSESRAIWRDATDSAAIFEGTRQRSVGDITDFDLSSTIQNFGRMSPRARDLVLNTLWSESETAVQNYNALSADPTQVDAANAASEVAQNYVRVYQWVSGANTLLGEAGQRLEAAYGLTPGSTASAYLAGGDLASARNGFYSNFGITNSALGAEDVFFAMATSPYGNLFTSLRTMNPDSTAIEVQIRGGMTGAYEVAVTNADGSMHTVYAKRFDMRPDAEGARNYNRAGIFASNCATSEPYLARDTEALFINSRTTPPSDPQEIALVDQMTSFMAQRNLNPDNPDHVRIAASAVADNNNGMFYDGGNGWVRYGFSNSIRSESLGMHTSDPHVTVGASVVGAVELWNIETMPWLRNIFTNHREAFWREVGYLFGAEGALTSYDGHEANVWALRVRIDDPSPTNLESLGYRYATDASGTRTLERIPGREQPYFLSLEHDLNGNEVIDGFRLGRIDTDDAAGAFMVGGYSSTSFNVDRLASVQSSYGLATDRFFDTLADIHNRTASATSTPTDMLNEAFGTGGSGPLVQGIRTWAQQHLSNGQFASSVEAGINANAGTPTGISFHLSSDELRPLADQFNQHGMAYGYHASNGENRMPVEGFDGRTLQRPSYELFSINSSSALMPYLPLNQPVYLVPADPSLGLPIFNSGTAHEYSIAPNLESLPESLRASAISATRTIGVGHTDSSPVYYVRADSGFGTLTGMNVNELGAIPAFRWLVGRGEDGLVQFWETVRSGLANTYTTPRPNP